MTESRLTSQRVDEIIRDCLFRNSELPETTKPLPPGAVLSEGVVHTYAFHHDRLESHRAEIIELLDELPIAFQPPSVGGGGGATFLGAAADRHGHLWGQHIDMEALFCLGAALGLVEWLRHPMLIQNSGIPWVRVLSEQKIDKAE